MNTPNACSIPSPTSRGRGALAALAAVLLLVATTGPVLADPDATAYEQRRAAMVMANDGDLVEAAEYLVLAVGQLAADDPEQDDNLRLAARLYHHAGDLDAAWRTMVNAGVAAYRLGDAVRAGNDLVDATVVAVEAGHASRAWDTAHKVGFVLRTAELEAGERLAILERIQVGPLPGVSG